MPEYVIYQPSERSGAGARISKIRRPAPIKELLAPVAVSLSIVVGAITGLIVLEGAASEVPPSESIIFGAPAQPGFRFKKIDTVTARPVRYNPCAPIHYVVNGRAAPPGAIADVHEAVRTVAEISGMSFTFDGLTDENGFERLPFQPERYGERWAPVLIGWHHLGENALSPTPMGEGGSVIRRNAAGESLYVTGAVSLNADHPGVKPGFGEGRTWGKILLHELGHVLGLGHVSEQSELMYPAATSGPSRLGTGDRLGLMSLGARSGCLDSPPPS